MGYKEPFFYTKLSKLQREFDYLFEIIRGDYYLSNDAQGISIILKIIFLRFKTVNSNIYQEAWTHILNNGSNPSLNIDYVLDQIHRQSIEFNFDNIIYRPKNEFKPQTVYTITEIISFLNSIPLEMEYDDPRILAEVFYVIALKLLPFKRSNNNMDHFTDENVSQIIAGIVNLKQGDLVFDPFIGIGGLLFRSVANTNASYSSINMFGQDINSNLLDICRMLFGLLYPHDLTLHLGDSMFGADSVVEKFQGKFDKIITHIPYNMKLHRTYEFHIYGDYCYSNSMNYLIIMNIIHMLNHTGQAFVVAPNNVLYCGGKDKEIRKKIIDDDLIEAVIDFSDYSIYKSSVKPVIIVFNTKKEHSKRNKIHLLNVQDDDIEEVIRTYKKYKETENSRIVSLNTISSRSYNLNFSHYDPIYDEVKLMLGQNIGVTLGSVVRVVKPIIGRTHPSTSTGIPCIKQINLNRDSRDVFLELKNVDNFESPEYYHPDKLVFEKAIIVALQGKDLKPTIFDPEQSNVSGILLSSNALALIPRTDINDPINIEYLYYQLYNPRVIRQIDGYKRGTTVKRISYNDLLNVVITKPEYEKQLQLIKDQEEPLKELEKYKTLYEELFIKLEVEKVKAENRVVNMLIHNVGKHISVVGHDIHIIAKVLDEHRLANYIFDKQEIERINSSPEVINGLLKKRESVTVQDVLKRTQDRLDLIEKTFTDTQKTVNLNLDSKDYEEVNIKELIKLIKGDRKLTQTVSYDFIIEGDDAFLNINVQSFKEMIHLIINNAEEHAFLDSEESKNHNFFIKFVIKKTKNRMIIEYSNNGSKFNIEKEDFILAGKKSINSDGSGLGGAYLNRVILSHHGSFEIVNSGSGAKFIFSFQINKR